MKPKPFLLLPLPAGLAAAAVVLMLGLLSWGLVSAATQTDIIGPVGSGQFGRSVTALPNGNIVVTDPFYDEGAAADVGAVYLYSGASGALISKLTGSTAGDQVSSGGVIRLTNGHYVVHSPNWDNGAAWNAGVVTWGNGTTGVTGVVSVTNSLVGGTAGDGVGSGGPSFGGVTPLSNGHYVVRSPNWDNGAARNAGAVTWGNGTTGVTGVVSVTNSLVGSTADDRVGYGTGFGGATALSNGHYVVLSPEWDNSAARNAGAVTWGNGTTGVTGVVSVTNSLVGSTAFDSVGYCCVTALSNGHYVVISPYWHNGAATDAGAVTWGSGTTGVTGVVSVTNSLVGSMTGDAVGFYGVTPLSNGHYVVRSPFWDNSAAMDAGAVTWGNGTTGITGIVSVTNSLVGSTANDFVGSGSVTALSNGHYVVHSLNWDNGAATDAGAVTWGNGTTGVVGVVSVTNSLVGSTTNDLVGSGGVTALSNGHYVVHSPEWDNGAATDAGAVTWGNGTTGVAGTVGAENSVRGSAANGGRQQVFAYDAANGQLVVGRPADNIVTLFRPDVTLLYRAFLPLILK